jgi:hypothetical protein
MKPRGESLAEATGSKEPSHNGAPTKAAVAEALSEDVYKWGQPILEHAARFGSQLCGKHRGEAVLRPGDTIEPKIGSVPTNDITSVSGAYMIDGHGYVNMPNLGKVKNGGLTI